MSKVLIEVDVPEGAEIISVKFARAGRRSTAISDNFRIIEANKELRDKKFDEWASLRCKKLRDTQKRIFAEMMDEGMSDSGPTVKAAMYKAIESLTDCTDKGVWDAAWASCIAPQEAEHIGIIDKSAHGCIRWREGLLRKDLQEGDKVYTHPPTEQPASLVVPQTIGDVVAQAEVAELRADNEWLEELITILKEEDNTLRAENAELKRRIAELEAAHDERRESIDRLNYFFRQIDGNYSIPIPCHPQIQQVLDALIAEAKSPTSGERK